MSTAAQITARRQIHSLPKRHAPQPNRHLSRNRHPEEQTQFAERSVAFLEELRPYTPSEQTQFKQLLLAAWNIDCSHRLEAELAVATGIDPILDETTYSGECESCLGVFRKVLHRLGSFPSSGQSFILRPLQIGRAEQVELQMKIGFERPDKPA